MDQKLYIIISGRDKEYLYDVFLQSSKEINNIRFIDITTINSLEEVVKNLFTIMLPYIINEGGCNFQIAELEKPGENNKTKREIYQDSLFSLFYNNISPETFSKVFIFIHFGDNSYIPLLRKRYLEKLLNDPSKYKIRPYSYGNLSNPSKISTPWAYFKNRKEITSDDIYEYLKAEFEKEEGILPTTDEVYFLMNLNEIDLERKNFRNTKDSWKFSHEKPILFIGEFDIGSENEKYDGRWRYIDSSIWTRYASSANRKEIIDEIKNYHNKGIYQLGISSEFRDFQKELLNISIGRLDEKGSSSHAIIAPFTFHSETSMEIAASSEIETIKELRWRILIVDDYAKGFPENKKLSKKSIITDLLKKYGIINQIEFESVITISEAKDKILSSTSENSSTNFYDLILLDFLFVDPSDGAVDYGSKLLFDISEFEETKKVFTPFGTLGKYWIMPISAYQNALIDKLRNKGLETNEKYWIISEGADPVCTPQLFAYKLFHLLGNQVERIADIDNKLPFSKLRKILENLVNNTDEKFALFPKLVELGVLFKQMSSSKERSLFANSAIENFFFGIDEQDWDHLQNFVYLLCYGGVHQKGIIWNEVFHFRRKYNNKKDFALVTLLNNIMEQFSIK